MTEETKINHCDMVAQLAKPGIEILDSLSANDCHLWHMSSCILGEVAELSIAVTFENRLEELGDIEFYLEGLRQGLGVTIDQVLEQIIIPTAGTTLVSDAADIFDVIKKSIIYRKPLNMEEIIMHLARFQAKLGVYRQGLNICRKDALDANIEKLGKLYKGHNYSDAAAQDRADKPA